MKAKQHKAEQLAKQQQEELQQLAAKFNAPIVLSPYTEIPPATPLAKPRPV